MFHSPTHPPPILSLHVYVVSVAGREVMSVTHSPRLPLSCVLVAIYTVFYQLNYPSDNSLFCSQNSQLVVICVNQFVCY